MSKRIVEISCGDPKTNQQTASKVECVINVNNSLKSATKNPLKVTDETDCFDTNLEVDPPTVKEHKNMRDISQSLYVSRQIIRDEPVQPVAAEGYIQTASRPTITEAEITSSTTIKDILIKAYKNILTINNAALVSQILTVCKYSTDGETKKIILELTDLKALIGAVVRLVDPDFKDSDIKIKVIVNDVEVGCCGMSNKATLVNPFNEISSISIGNQDMKIHQFEAWNTIEEKLGVSLTYVYSITKDSVINVEQESTA